MVVLIQIGCIVFLGWAVWRWWHTGQRKRQQAYINSYQFHPAIKTKLQERHPQLRADEVDLVFRGLRNYFRLCNLAGKRMVAMPSQVVDDAWHEFILFTRAYQTYCHKALGRFLHHVPAQAMQSPTSAQDGIKRAWRIACHLENINPHSPTRLPLLFEIDTRLNIAKGFRYSLNCRDRNSPAYGSGYCATDIGCSSGCSGSSGSAQGCNSDSGSGCGGDGGCGGGCGGD